MPKSQEQRGIVVVHVYLSIEEFDTSDITELLKQHELWEAHAKEYFIACEENLLRLQESCYTKPVVEEGGIQLWSVIIFLNLIIFSVSFAFPRHSLYLVVMKF